MEKSKRIQTLLNTLFDMEEYAEELVWPATEFTEEDYPVILRTLSTMDAVVQENLEALDTFVVFNGADDALYTVKTGYAIPYVLKGQLERLIGDIRRVVLMINKYIILDREIEDQHIPVMV